MNTFKEILIKLSNHRDKNVDYEALIPSYELKVDKRIPKKIFQTYKTSALPSILQNNVDNIIKNNVGWDYKLYTNEEIEKYIRCNYGDTILSYYNRINPLYGAAKADLFRYLLMYKEGGVYLDLKSNTTVPLDEIVCRVEGMLISNWDNQKGQMNEGKGSINNKELINIGLSKGEYIQWAIICEPHHPFLKSVIIEVLKRIDYYNPHKHWVGKEGVLCTTGPIPFTIAIVKELNENSNVRFTYVEDFSKIGLIYSFFDYNKMDDKHYSMNNDFGKYHYSNVFEPIVDNCNFVMSFINSLLFKFVKYQYTKGSKRNLERI